ncbi:hypothetical protein [Sphingobacterium deserti]
MIFWIFKKSDKVINSLSNLL